MPASSPQNMLVFRTDLLSYSETFIPAQAEQFRTFTPYYVGLRRIKGVTLPDERMLIAPPLTAHAKLPGLKSLFGKIDPAFKETIQALRPELIHAHFEEGGIQALDLSRTFKLPLVVTCHGYDVTVERTSLKKLFLGRKNELFKNAAGFVAISGFIRDQMVRAGYPSKKIRLHYIGVDIDKFRPDPSIVKEPAIVYVGRLTEKKGADDLLKAMKIVKPKFPEVKLKIIGDGPLKESLTAYSRENQLNVEFCGVQSPDAIQKQMQASLMFSLPSVRAANGDSEGLGIVNLEAQAVGIPVVGTLHGGIPEAVENGVTGLLSAERNPAALADSILILLSDSNLREKMGLAARQRMIQHFDLKQQSGLLEKIYLELL